VGHGDDGDIGPHIDYTGRIVYNRSGTSSGNHGDHVAGTILGGGIYDPDGMGLAPGADLVYSSYPANFTSVDQDYVNYNVRITTSSYSNGCNAGYTSTTQQVDNDILQNPKLMHVFSAGNSASSDCGYGAGSGWGNITGGHKAGKNVIASASMTSSDVISSFSSRGPASDGRIKPDVAALGSNVYSSVAGNGYANYSGTSMACPGVSGGMAVLLQAYKDVHGQEPDGGLLKAIIQNTADDIGNAGPDFIYGYGRMNIERGVELISNSQFLTGSMAQGGSSAHSIPVPANVSKLKVMVYWTDPAASPSSGRALVNNIDCYVERSGQTWNPWVLDPTPNATALSSPAVRAVDSLNNMEQVTIDNPTQGDHIVRVSGTAIPQGPQTYYVVYSYEMNGISVDFPSSGVAIEPGQSTTIRWNASPSASGFSLEYSLNGGGSWSSIGTAGSSARQLNWTPPSSAATGNARIRISRGGTTAVGSDFTLIGQPDNIQFLWTCPDSTYLSWNSVSGAVGYQVNMLGSRNMDSLSSSTTNNAVVNGVPSAQSVWFSVQAITPQGTLGKRSIAKERPAGLVSCPATCILSGTVVLNSASTTSLDLDLSNPLTSAQSYQIEYGPAGFARGSGTTLTSTTSNFVISGLTASTSYDVYVEALCTNGQYTNAASGTFSTACATFNLPYSSDMSLAAFSCWVASDPNYVYINANCPSAGNSELTLWGQAGLYAESADIMTGGAGTITVSYDYYDPQVSPCGENADAGEQVAIGWVEPNGTFNQMAVYDGGSAPTSQTSDQFVITLSGQSSIRIRMQVLSGTSSQYDNWAFDNLLVTGGGSVCAPPTALTAANIGSNSADLSWSAGNTGSTAWTIEYGLAGFSLGSGSSISHGSTSYSLSGLNPNTAYEYVVTETCSDGTQSVSSMRYAFSTTPVACTPFTAPYSEDFETAILGAQTDFGNCWTSSNGSGNPLWIADQGGTPSVGTGPLGDHTTGSGTYLFTESSSPASTGDTVMLLSPQIDLSALTSPMLEFHYHMFGAAMGSLHVDVFDGSGWTRGLLTLTGQQQTAQSDPYNRAQVLLSGYSGMVQIRFRSVCGSSYTSDMALDDVSVLEAPLCPDPSSVSVSNITQNGAQLAWTGTSSSYEIEYGTTGFALGNGSQISSSTNSTTLTGLSASTNYDVYVRGNCGSNGTSNWTGPVSFSTAVCGASNLCTYTVSMTDTYGDGWNGAVVDVVQGGVTVASFGSSFITGSGPVTAPIDLCDGLFTSVVAAQPGGYPTEVGFVISDPNGVAVLSHSAGSSFASGFNFGSFTSSCAPINCPDPAAFAVSNVLSSSADLSWTGSAAAYEVEYGLSGFSQGNGSLLTTANTTIGLSGLTANTAYDAYVRADCGTNGYSLWAGPVSFTTASVACTPFTAPYSEDFETAILGAQTDFGNCWTSSNGSGNPLWIADQGGTPSSGTGPLGDHTTGSGTYLFTESSSPASTGDTVMLLSPQIDLSALTSPMLEFHYHMFGAAMGSLHVDVSDGSGWTRGLLSLSGQQQTAQSDPYNRAQVLLNGFSGTVQIRFRSVRGSSYTSDMALDEVSVLEAPLCPDPSSVSVSNITQNGAQLAWAGASSSYDIEYGTTGFALGNGSQISSSTNSTTLTGLSASTTYDVYVRGNCGSNGTSNWTGPLSFTTLCASASIPYLRDFDGSNWPPLCWDLSGGTRTVLQNSSDYMEGNYWSWTSGNFALATTEPISISSDARIKYRWAHLYNSTYPNDQLIVRVRLATSSSWDTLVSHIGPTFSSPNATSTTPPADSDFIQEIVNLDAGTYTGKDVVFQLVFNSGFGPDVFVDDFIVEPMPACPEPTTITASAITANTADLSWANGNAAANTWYIEYGPVGFPMGSGTVVTANSNPYTLTGLNSATAYTAYVSELCQNGVDTSAYSLPVSFSTTCVTASLPYNTGFTAVAPGITGAIPLTPLSNCWEIGGSGIPRWETEDASGVNENSLNTGPFYDATTPGASGGMYLYLECSGGSLGDTAAAKMVPVDLGAGNTELEFYYHMYGASMGNLYVQINDGSGWTTLDSLIGEQQTAGSDSFQQRIVPLTGYSGIVSIKFLGARGSSFTSDMAIDEISVVINGNPSCLSPTALTASNISATGATLSWTAGNSGYSNHVIEYGPAGFAQGSGNVVTSFGPPLWFLTGLSPSTAYEYYVIEVCGNGGQSAPSARFSFTTAPAPSCQPPTNLSAGNIGTSGATLSWTAGNTSYTEHALEYGPVGFAQGSGTAITGIKSLTTTLSGLSPNTQYEFYVTEDCGNGSQSSPSARYAFTTAQLACVAPGNLNASSITHNSAQLSWTAGGTETQWEVSIDLTGLGTVFGARYIVNAPSFSATNLTASVTYDFFVRSLCTAGDSSDWSGPYTFATSVPPPPPAACLAIDSISILNAKQGSMRAHFAAASGTIRRMQFMPVGDSLNLRTKAIASSSQTIKNFNATPFFNKDVAVWLQLDTTGNGDWSTQGCGDTLFLPCKDQTLQMVEQRAATCAADSVMVRAGYAGGYGTPTILWSNGATTKRTFAQQGQTLTVTITDASGCSVSDSITASTLDNTAVPGNWTLLKGGPTIFNGSFTAPSLPSGATLIGYRMAYRLRGTQTWTNTPLSQNTTISVDFTGSGLPGGNYEFVAFTRYRLNGVATNSNFTCRIAKGYNGSGGKRASSSASGADENAIHIYPNPVENTLYVSAGSGAEISLLDASGKTIAVQTSGTAEVQFDMSALAQGVYMLLIQTEDEFLTERIVKN
jgi:hypothetical protein